MKNCIAESASSFKLHVTNIIDIQHCPITTLDLKKDGSQLALYRGGDAPAIEIWNVSNVPFLQEVLYDLENNDGKPSVESLLWIQHRLFSCGLHGFVLEHDIVTRKIKAKYMATSGPVWQISASPNGSFLAAGTEDGFINIFSVMDDGLEFVKVLDRQEGRVLCLSWSPCGKYIATGSVDNVRLWDVEKRHAVQRLITGRSKNTETIVWSILLLENLTIVSGDSRGIVSFWDGNLGVLKYKIWTHKADILALKLSTDGDCIYVSGVDPSVVLLAHVGNNEDKWVKSHQRNMHTNDVMCLATLGNKLISAGRDCDLTISSPPRRNMPKIVTKYPPIPKSSRIFSSKNSKRIMIQDPKAINIWQLPNESTEELVKLLEIKSASDQIIHSSCLSPSGQTFAYATKNRLTVFTLLTLADGSLTPVKLKKIVSNDGISIDLTEYFWMIQYLSDTQILAITVDGSYCLVIDIDSTKSQDSILINSEISLDEFVDPVGIDMITTHSNGRHFAVATSKGDVHVLEVLSSSSLKQVYTVPQYKCPILSLRFHPQQNYLLIAFADHTVEIINYQNCNIVFHEQIGGPKEPAKVEPNVTSTNEILIKTIATEEECNQHFQPILGTSWSPDGMKAVLYELNKIHLMEFSEVCPIEGASGEPATKKLKESATTRGRRSVREVQDLTSSSSQRSSSKDTPKRRTRNPSSESTSSNTPSSSQDYKEEQWISSKLALLRVQKSVETSSLPVSKNLSKYSCFVTWKSLNIDDEYVTAVDFLDSNQLLSVQVKPSVIFNKLPPAFAKKKFGM